MSRTGVLIAVIFALLLGVAAWLLLGRSSPGPSNAPGTTEVSGPLIEFRPSDIRAVIIERSGDRTQRLVRDGESWSLVIDREDEAPDTWPVAAGQVRALLSVLQSLTPVADAPSGSLDDPAVVVTLTLADGASHTLRIGRDAVGGRRLARANDGDLVYIDMLIVEALTSPGPRAWREMRVFPTVGAETSRIHLMGSNAAISIARVRGDWRLREPVRAPAENAAVDRLLNQLAALSVERWIDDPNAARGVAIAPGAGVMRMVVERDRRFVNDRGEPDVQTDRREVIVGPSADLSGASRLIYIGEARTPAVVAAGAIASLQTGPEALISRRAVDVGASQVAAIRIRRGSSADEALTFELKRTIDGWSHISDSDETPIASADVISVLALLTERIADDITIRPRDLPAPHAAIELRGFDGGLLVAVTLHTDSDGLTIVTDDIARHYRGVAVPNSLDGAASTEARAIDEPVK